MEAVKYEGPIPKSLKNFCDLNSDKIQEVSAGGGYCTDRGGFAYDVLLRNGWRYGGDYVHTIIEPTVKETIEKLQWVVPCECSECRR